MISAISVKDRLKNQAVASGKTFQEALTAYGLERTVYRLSVSEYVEHFTLKGVNTEIRNTQSQLRDVDKLLKLDSGNTELLAQKHRLPVDRRERRY